MHIPSRKMPWNRDTHGWMCFARVEHYLRMKVVDLDAAAYLALGLLPELWEPPYSVMWFDVPFSKRHIKDGDHETVWQWMADAKELWVSCGGTADKVDLWEFLEWVESTYEAPHWLSAVQASEMWTTINPSRPARSPKPASRGADLSSPEPNWLTVARRYATEYWESVMDTSNPSKVAISQAVAKRLRAEGVNGPRGPLQASTIEREALRTWKKTATQGIRESRDSESPATRNSGRKPARSLGSP